MLPIGGKFEVVAVGRIPTGQIVQDRLGSKGIFELRLRQPLVVAVIVMTAEAGLPFAFRDQFAMRDIERIVLQREIPVTGRAGSRIYGDPHALVLTVAVHAGLGAQLFTGLLESRLEEAMRGMRILIARMTVHATLVADAIVPEGRVRLLQAEVKANLGLQLLAQGARRLLVTIGAGKLLMAGIGRSFCSETARLWNKHERDPRQEDERAEHICSALDGTFAHRGPGVIFLHVRTTGP